MQPFSQVSCSQVSCSQVSHTWQDSEVAAQYKSGVSLHSHTSLSLETLSFVHAMCTTLPLVGRVVDACAKRTKRRRGLTLDFESAHWRPPLVPLMAYQLEHRQIAAKGLRAMVSITDHDDIQAPLLLRTIPIARGIPVSTEWTAPFGATAFHLGIHNLPSADGPRWMQRFKAYTANPDEDQLHAMLQELHAIDQVLIVCNHPIWDLYKIGDKLHMQELERFLTRNNGLMHALELNGLRHARENGQVMVLARRWAQVLISGGDRHGMEANACINLTNARNFTDFVHEIRIERKSHILFMEQYRRPWEHRILDSTIEAISDHPQFSPGWQRWDDRVFHVDCEGVLRPISQLWPNGRAPRLMQAALAGVRICRLRTMGLVLSMLFGKGTTNEGSAAVREAA